MRFGKTDQERYDERKRIEQYKKDNRSTSKTVFAWLPIKSHNGGYYWLVKMTKYTYWDNWLGFDLKQKSIYWPSNK